MAAENVVSIATSDRTKLKNIGSELEQAQKYLKELELGGNYVTKHYREAIAPIVEWAHKEFAYTVQ